MFDLSQETLVIASHNEGKVREIRELLAPFVAEVISANDLDLEEPEETGKTFEENAVLKAELAAKASGEICLADDSGLAVNALNGDPGIYSARWGGPEKDFNLAMQKVHDALGDNPDRSAYFVCVLALAFPDGGTETFDGRVNGNLIWPPRGDKGFGYDPIFIADGMDETFGEIDPAQKHSISHRANAFVLLQNSLLKKAV